MKEDVSIARIVDGLSVDNMNYNNIINLCSSVFSDEHIYCIDTNTDINKIKESISKSIIEHIQATFIILIGDSNPEEIYSLAKYIKETTSLKVCWYSGCSLRKDFPKEYFDYIKTGPYIEELGGLDSMTTNQRFYEIRYKEIKNIKGETINSYRYLEDVTSKFWKNNKTNINARDYTDDEE